MLTLPQAVWNPEHPLAPELKDQLALVDPVCVDRAKADKAFLALGAHYSKDQDEAARIWILLRALQDEIPRVRLRLLAQQRDSQRPAPYDHPAVGDLDIDSDYLVPLAAFKVSGGALFRRGFAFSVASPLEAVNSQYWTIQALRQQGLGELTMVRLDPLLVRAEQDYPAMHYRMWWYGRPLDWRRIDNLREEEHGRWLPGALSTKAEFIDYVWSPRGSEVHFRCEELPKKGATEKRGSRYFHAIYEPAGKRISHLDGSIRVYGPEQWDSRSANHLRNSGKVGNRIKLFRVSGVVDLDCLAEICIGFFVWSFDVARYFGLPVPDEL